MKLKLAWAIQQVPSQPELHGKTPFKNKCMGSTCLYSVVDATHRDGSIGNGDPLLIRHHTLDATVHLQRGDVVGAHIDSTSTPLPSLTPPSVQAQIIPPAP